VVRAGCDAGSFSPPSPSHRCWTHRSERCRRSTGRSSRRRSSTTLTCGCAGLPP